MKRRTFIASLFGVGALAAAAPIAYVSTHKKELATEYAKRAAKKKATTLFKRFFKIANNFEMNAEQERYWEQYCDGEFNCYSGRRQLGQTTFMLTLALYEQKCLATPNNVILCYGSHWVDMVKHRLEILEGRLGKSVKDGKLDVAMPDSDILRGQLYNKSFIMNDANVNSRAFMGMSGVSDSVSDNHFACCYAKKHMFFGTYETQSYKASELIPAKYFYAPYIPLTYA